MADDRISLSDLPGPGLELLYGRHAVLETLRAGRRRIVRVCLGQGVQETGTVAEIVTAAARCRCPVFEVSKETLGAAGAVNHQGVLAEAGPYPYADLDQALAVTAGGDPLFLVLDHLQDVQNLGTLLRTAEAMAVQAVLMPARRAAGITPAVVNASAGAVEHLRIALVGNLVQVMERLKQDRVWVVGLDAGPEAKPLGEADLTGPLALVLGAEGSGLARLVREHCDWLLAIPMHGQVASLNAAVAGSVALVAAREARGGLTSQGLDQALRANRHDI